MKKKQLLPILVIGGLILLVLLYIIGSALIKKYTPSKERKDLAEYYAITEENQVAITLNHTVLETYATTIDEHIYLDYTFVHDVLNSRFYWDANENILLYTTANDIISAKADATSYNVGKSSAEYGRPIVKATAESAWVDLEFVKNYSDFSYNIYEAPTRIVIINDWKEIKVSTLKSNTEVRVKGGIKSPILSNVKKGSAVTVLEKGKKWTKVCTEDGITGYIQSDKLKKAQTKTLTSEYTEETFHRIKTDFAINLLWHPVFSKTANNEISSIISEAKGLNVISPSWFKLKDNKGNLSSFASMDYVTYCHNHNVQVWAMVKNMDLDSKDIDTNYILTHTSSRQNLVNQIVSQALQYNLDGINIDFEKLDYAKVGDAYIQFLRELSIKCENNDIILSTAVMVPEPYNYVYKYSEQAYFVDYICLMAYDEHTSQESGEGSVASLSWVDKHIKTSLEHGISPDQLVLGIPFYTRLWDLTPTSNDEGADVNYLIGYKNLGLTSAKKWLNDNISNPVWLEDAGQYYGEIEKKGVLYKIWLEDEASIEQKLKLMQQYKLAGAAFWSSALDNNSIWEVIIKYIN